MNVQKKILLGFLVLLGFVIVSGGLSIFQMKQMGVKAEDIQDNWLPSVVMLGQINKLSSDTPRLLNSMGLENDSREMEQREKEILQTLEEIDKLLQEYEMTITDEEAQERQYFEEFSKSWEVYKNQVPAMITTAKGSDSAYIISELKKTVAAWETAQEDLARMIEFNKQSALAATDESVNVYTTSLYILITVMSIATLAGVALILLIIRDIRRVASNIVQSSHTVASSSEEITASIQEVASGSQHQASMVNSITEMIEQMDIAISQISANIEETSTLVNQTSSAAENGGHLMNNAMEGMQDISKKVHYLLENSRKIDVIVTTIKDIADQTKLLALNASIEAARAGEHGRGFAVVADSVGKLANQSGEATKEIIHLVQRMQESTQDTVETVRSGNELILHAGQSFTEIIEYVKNSAARITEVAASCEEQAAQTNEILQSAQNIAAVTQQTSASTEETASATEELSSMAENLNQLVSKL
ncbi:HAMP domain-containing methyl-accepting chemotaxis protein [Brevibacillus panacihumi]|uniref:Methyl-accepting chemotaxis protein n=1 Tax=Brevibacillus panacihumi TaxID=497735 RepID=A0A3M8CT07_9BACL|nr:methyl-accepting chemotaxis protein [Brevibacillus panacihumi]RNB78417.1 methyl-accepting chemotaxis protein [Brevibacillus panacihumi]